MSIGTSDDLGPGKRYLVVKTAADYRIIRMWSAEVGENAHYGPVNSHERREAVHYGASWRISLSLYTPLSAVEASQEEFVFFVLHADGSHTAWTTLLNEVLRSLPARNTGAMVNNVKLERLSDGSVLKAMLQACFE